MKKFMSYKNALLLSALLILAGCIRTAEDNPYRDDLHKLCVVLNYPAGYESFAHAGADVTLDEINRSLTYHAKTDEKGRIEVDLPSGLYRISVNDRVEDDLFNATLDRYVLRADSKPAQLDLIYSRAGTLLIKEIYCGGCKKTPETGDYQADQYIILHNNDVKTVYLDSLCFGALAPYNSNATNPWGGVASAAPLIQALWQFGGNGTSFPLASGEDAVLCLRGAIDHTVKYPLSVNLNKADYFVCYNNTYFTNENFHPVPGSNIQPQRYLDVVVKTGQANAFTFSINSPAVVIFRPQGMSAREFVRQADVVVPVPGSAFDRAVMVPWEWIIDGVEVFNGSTTSNTKRIRTDVDAGYVTLSESFLGHVLVRKVDEELSAINGYEVLADSNNSSLDFYEQEKASLHNEKK